MVIGSERNRRSRSNRNRSNINRGIDHMNSNSRLLSDNPETSSGSANIAITNDRRSSHTGCSNISSNNKQYKSIGKRVVIGVVAVVLVC